MEIHPNESERELFALVQRALGELRERGVELWAAGGWVRDRLLGRPCSDIDFAVSGIPGGECARRVQRVVGGRARAHTHPRRSAHLQTASVAVGEFTVDFARLRRESYDAQSRIPAVETEGVTLHEDALRRDFTLNALYYDLAAARLEDPIGRGLDDLERGVLVTTIDPLRSFADDPLRLLRAIRFAASMAFELAPEILAAARAPGWSAVLEAAARKLSAERIWRELAGVCGAAGWEGGFLSGSDPVRALELMAGLGLRDRLLRPTPEERAELGLGELLPWDMDQHSPYHALDLWQHTLAVVAELGAGAPLELVLAALFHDLGKADTGARQLAEDGRASYHGHEGSSARIAERVLRRLGAPAGLAGRVVHLIANHMRPLGLLAQGGAVALRRFARDLGADWECELDLARADLRGHAPARLDERACAGIDDLRARIHAALAAGGGATEVPLPIGGGDLLAAGFEAGPRIGRALAAVREALLETPGLTRERALEIARGVE